MSRRFKVSTHTNSRKVYDVVLDGTTGPEEAEVDWLAIVRELEPVQDSGEFIAIAFIEEITDGGQ